MKKSVRMADIAERLGISISTVSKGLHGASDISEDLRQLVLDTAIEMGYQSKRMKNQTTKKLCIFIIRQTDGKRKPMAAMCAQIGAKQLLQGRNTRKLLLSS